MKHTLLSSLTLALTFLSTAPLVPGTHASTYADTDLLLTFRLDPTKNDVTFNLGTVSNFLGHAAGTQIVVTNWDAAMVRDNFGGSLQDVIVTLQAAVNVSGNRHAWLSIASGGTPTAVSGSQLGQIRSKVAGVGEAAAGSTLQSPEQFYVVSPNASSSYSFIVSSGGTLPLPTLGGQAPGTTQTPLSASTIEGAIPATLRFFDIPANNTSPKPAATQIGTFTLSDAGVLTFVAGSGEVVSTPPPVPQILSRSRAGGTFSVSFTTTNGVTYRLRHADSAALASTSVSNWLTGASVTGDGTTKTLQDTTSAANRFYRVEATK